MSLLPGTIVQARGLTWEILHVDSAGPQQRYRLRCAQGDLRGFELDLLHPFEPITPVQAALDPTRAATLTNWLLYHDAFLLDQALGPAALVASRPGRLDLAPYQLVPTLRALRMGRVRLLLADGVGLGKTIQAGLVMVELIARRRAHRVLVVSPAGPLLEQWRTELRTRFGLRFQTVRSQAEHEELRRHQVLGDNPFDHVSLCLTSIDFAKQDKVLQELERTSWDLVVIDEAHHVCRLGAGSGDAVTWDDSRRRRLAEVLARQSDGLLLLTATPHDGFDAHFASLIELLDPSLLDGRNGLRGELYRRHVVRRLKRHVTAPDGSPLFPERRVTPVPVAFSPATLPAFSALQTGLVSLIAPRLKRALHQKKFGEVLAFLALLKRSVSSVRAARETLARIRDRFAELVRTGQEEAETRKQRMKTLTDYRRRLERYGALSFEEEADQATLEAEDMAADLAALDADPDAARILEARLAELRTSQSQTRARDKAQSLTLAALSDLVGLADDALAEDPKTRALIAEIRAIRAREPHANVLVYTEYTDTQDVVVAALASSSLGTVLQIRGEDGESHRESVTERFAREDDLILVSTDATAEGLNLHYRCHHLVHIELPYNPNRLEQRNGRIDRYGQKHPPEVRYLYLQGTFEERLLLRLVAKFERQRSRLTFVPNTLGLTATDTTTVSLLTGYTETADDGPDLFARPARTPSFIDAPDADSDVQSPALRDLLSEIDRAMTGFEKAAKAHAWLGETGSFGDRKTLDEAERAYADGDRLAGIDPIDFTLRALESEGAGVQRPRGTGSTSTPSAPVATLAIPPSWNFGLDDLPGFDPGTRLFRLALDRTTTTDAEGRPVGTLGRAHPLVRRALERVRNLRHGETGWLDRRVSAATFSGPSDAVLWTFLAAVETCAGHVFERVIAVRATPSTAPEVLLDPQAWRPDRSAALDPRGLWESRFATWAPSTQEAARASAEAAFRPLTEAFAQDHDETLTREHAELDAWFRLRADQLAPVAAPRPVALDLFAPSTQDRAPAPIAKDPASRLAALAIDKAATAAQRAEAQGILNLHAHRQADLAERSLLPTRPPTLLGLLLLAATP